MSQYYICADYEPFDGTIGKLLLVMALEDEIRGKWSGGDVITVSGKEYVLGPKEVDKRNKITTFELVSRGVPALSLDDGD